MNINYGLLPIKIHYFVYFGAEAGILPYLSIIAGQFGISVTVVGIIFTILPFIALAAKPFFGGIADHLQKLKLIILIFIIVSTTAYVGINFIPNKYEIENSTIINILINCNPKHKNYRLSELHNISCISENLKNFSEHCELSCQSCTWTDEENRTIQNALSVNNSSSCDENYAYYKTSFLNSSSASGTDAVWEIVRAHPMCLNKQSFNCDLKCNNSLKDCLHTNEQSDGSFYDTLQFWLLVIFISFAWVSSGVITSLSDAACYELLEEKKELYGKQRLWGTVGWGIFSLLTGYLNDLITGDSLIKTYSASFYMLAGLMVLDFIVIASSNIKNAKLERAPLKNVCVLFTRIHVVVFIITVFFIGILTGLHWAYFFWYMNDLEADQLIMGLSLIIESFLGELPFFFFAGTIIEKFGHVNTINISLLFFAIRYILYYFIKNPWLVLPVKLLQGPTFGLFYATMTSYANFITPPGTEATMQGILGGVFEGLGIAGGSLLGGIGIHHYGTHQTFLIAGIMSLVCCIVHVLLHVTLSFVRKKEESGQ